MISMKRVLLLVSLLLALSSCSKIATKIVRFFGEEGLELVGKKALKDAGEDVVGEGAEKLTSRLLLQGVDESSEVVSKKLVRDGAEAAEIKVSSKVEKQVLKNSLDLTPENIPRGLRSLDVIEEGGGFVPTINNLNKNSSGYKVLLAERRKAITPSHQFPTLYQLKQSNAKQIIGRPASSDVLRKNMYSVMDPKMSKVSKAFGGNMAHHVVEGTDKAAEGSRLIFKKYNIDINDAANGILLPDGSDASIYKGAVHKTSHTKEYSELIYSRLKICKSRDEVITELTKIKHEIYEGKINLEGLAQVYNKNIR